MAWVEKDVNQKRRKNHHKNNPHKIIDHVSQIGNQLVQIHWRERETLNMCSRASPWYLWLDGRMDDHMTTCTQRATSHKCSILFSNNTLRPVPSHSGLLGSGLRPTLAFLSLLQSNFGACRGHQGWDQFTLSSVLQINSCTHSLLGLFRQEIINILLVKKKERKKDIFNILKISKSFKQEGINWNPEQIDMKVNWPPPWWGVNEDDFGWLVRAENVFCLEKSILHL